MNIENLSTLKIHKLTQEQYDRELEAGRIDPSALYLTPDENNSIYIQNEEPIGAEEGSLWIDMDAESSVVSGGGVVGDGSIIIDATLTKKGQAADARAVGEALVKKQPIGNYLTEHQDISHKLDASELSNAINTALTQAKASGDFDGKDYVLTDADKAEIAEQAAALVDVPDSGGKSAYEYAQDAGYTGTEEEFAKKMAQETVYVTVTKGENGDNYIADKSVSELVEAYENGHNIVCLAHVESMIHHIPLLIYYNQSFTFVAELGESVLHIVIVEGFVFFSIKKPESGAAGKSAYEYAKDAGYTGTEGEFAAKLASESSGIHIGTDAPTDDNVSVWIDTDEEIENFVTGVPGKSAYEYAKEGGYTGTEADFAAKLAEEYPTPDWNAAEGEPGHVLNRTHWVNVEKNKVFLDTTVTTVENMATAVLNTELQQGENYTVTFMGQTYSCHCKYIMAMEQVALVIGNTLAIDGNDTGEPFAVAYLPWLGFTVVMTLLPDGDYPIKIEGNYKIYNKISRALLPKPIWVIDCDLDVENPTVNVTQVELEPAIENGEFVALRDRMEGTTNFSILYFSGRSGGNLLFRQIPVGSGNAKYCILKPNISGGYDVVESII